MVNIFKLLSFRLAGLHQRLDGFPLLYNLTVGETVIWSPPLIVLSDETFSQKYSSTTFSCSWTPSLHTWKQGFWPTPLYRNSLNPVGFLAAACLLQVKTLALYTKRWKTHPWPTYWPRKEGSHSRFYCAWPCTLATQYGKVVL